MSFIVAVVHEWINFWPAGNGVSPCRGGYSTVDGQTVDLQGTHSGPTQTCQLQTTEPLGYYVQDVRR